MKTSSYTCDQCGIRVAPVNGLYERHDGFYATVPAISAVQFGSAERHACTQQCADILRPDVLSQQRLFSEQTVALGPAKPPKQPITVDQLYIDNKSLSTGEKE